MNKLNAHGPRPLLRLLLPLLLLGSLGSATHAADPVPFKYAQVTTVELTDAAALNSLLEKWTPFVKEHFPAAHQREFLTDDLGKALFVDFAQDLSDFDRYEKEFQAEIEKDAADYYTNFAKRTELRAKDPAWKEALDTLTQATRRTEIQHDTLHPEFSKLK